MKQALSVHDITAFSMGLLSYVKGGDVPGGIRRAISDSRICKVVLRFTPI
jgi:hypothetical protein